MTKAELIAQVANDARISKAEAERVVKAVLKAVSQALKTTERLSLPGLGTFVVRTRKARAGRNPQTGKAIKIPATKVVKFKPGKKLRGPITGPRDTGDDPY